MDIIQFHVKNNYYVSVKPIDKLCGCIAEYPENKLKNIPKITKTYILCDKTYKIDYYVNIGNIKKTDTIYANSANIRILVAQDVLLTTLKLGMISTLIIPLQKNLFETLSIPQTNQEKQKEARLCVEYSKLLSGEVPDRNVEGYDQLLSYFENGGFLL